MRNFGFIAIIYYIVMIVIIAFAVNFLLKKFDTAQAEVDERIGSSVVYKSDTLMITNYSLLNNSYGLDNGTEISAKLLDDLEVITKEE